MKHYLVSAEKLALLWSHPNPLSDKIVPAELGEKVAQDMDLEEILVEDEGD